MKYAPAIHIGFFGVFPDVEISDDLRESFIGRRSALHANEVALAGTLSIQNIENAARGKAGPEELYDFETFEAVQNMQDQIYHDAHIRMTSAYNFAAKKGWIKPVLGVVLNTPPFARSPEVSLIEQFETATLSNFHDLMEDRRRFNLGNVANSSKDQLTGMAHIRCIVRGEAVPFISVMPEKTYLLKSASPPHMEPDINPDIFDLAAVDMLKFCLRLPAYRRSAHTGYPPPPAAMTWEP